VKKTVRRAIGLVPLTLLGNCLTSFPELRDTGRGDAASDSSTLPDTFLESGGECDGGKICNDTCVSNDDLAYGCSPNGCNPCLGDNATTECVSGLCVLSACARGHFDCNGEVSDGCEATACTPIVIAADQYHPWTVRVDATHVYWTNASGPAGVNRISVSTPGPPEVLVGDADEGDLFLDADHIYWANAGLGLIRRLPKDNPTAAQPQLIGTGARPIGLVVDDTYVYWADAGDEADGGMTGSISRATKTGTEKTTLSSGLPKPWILAQDTDNLYFTSRETGSVYRLAKSGGAAQILAPGFNATTSYIQGFGVVVDDVNVYWRNDGFLRSVPKDASYADGGADLSVTLASDEPTARFVAIFGTQLAWVTQTQPALGMLRTLSTAPPNAGAETLATGAWATHGTELDAKFVYWTNWGSSSAPTGTVYKLRRKL
jgi:hypothetical protein